MSGSDDPSGALPDERDLLAAEYVIGLLGPAEARNVKARAVSDPALAAAINEWQSRLHPMTGTVRPVAPPPSVWARLEKAIGATPVPQTARRPRREWWRLSRQMATTWENAAFWRGMSVISFACGMALVGLLLTPKLLISQPAVAALTAQGAGAPAFLVMVTKDGYATVIATAAEVQPGNSLELWGLPEGAAAPVSLGVLPTTGRLRVKATVPIGSQLLVSCEPMGGSPSGQPTGPVVYKGQMVRG